MLINYESIFIISPELEEDEVKSLVEKIKNLIESEGELENIDEWGKRKLAYPINDFNEGYYVMMNFAAKPEFPQELERVYKITEGIIKDIIIKKDN